MTIQLLLSGHGTWGKIEFAISSGFRHGANGRGRFMSQTLELPENVYTSLVEAARSEGVTPTEWIKGKLPRAGGGTRTDLERSHAVERLLRHAGALDSGHPEGTDNDQIDADLARAYGEAHGNSP